LSAEFAVWQNPAVQSNFTHLSDAVSVRGMLCFALLVYLLTYTVI